jgi:hypothetical protein
MSISLNVNQDIPANEKIMKRMKNRLFANSVALRALQRAPLPKINSARNCYLLNYLRT